MVRSKVLPQFVSVFHFLLFSKYTPKVRKVQNQ